MICHELVPGKLFSCLVRLFSGLDGRRVTSAIVGVGVLLGTDVGVGAGVLDGKGVKLGTGVLVGTDV